MTDHARDILTFWRSWSPETWVTVSLVLGLLAAGTPSAWGQGGGEEPPEADLQMLMELFSGHIAVMPGPDASHTPRNTSVGRWLARRDLLRHTRALTPEEFVDDSVLQADRFPVLIYPWEETYLQTVHKPGDADEALLRYLSRGGTLLIMGMGPFPFYYNEKGQAVRSSAKLGLAIGGPVPERLAGLRPSCEGPPPGRALTFHTSAEQTLVPGLPDTIAYPRAGEADLRWRGSVEVTRADATYTPVISLRDDQGRAYGEGIALLEYRDGPLAGARVVYVWASLLVREELRTPIITSLLRAALAGKQPPRAVLTASFARMPPEVDGDFDDAVWEHVVPSRRFLPPTGWDQAGDPVYAAFSLQEHVHATVRVCWDRESLFLAFSASGLSGVEAPRFQIEYLGRNDTGRRILEEMAHIPDRVGEVLLAETSADPGMWHVEAAIPWHDVHGGRPRLGERQIMQFGLHVPGTPRTGRVFWSSGRFGYVAFGPDPLGDDFENYAPDATPSPPWRIQSGTWRIEGGNLVGENTGDDGYRADGAAFGDHTWRDYELSLRFKVDSYSNNWRDGPRVGFRCNAAGNGYHINVTDRHIQVHKTVPGGSTSDRNPLASAPWTRDTAWHTLTVRAVANIFEVRLGDRSLFSFRDDMVLGLPSYRSGGIRLSARRWTQAKGMMRVRFDDVVVTPLPPRKRWSFE